mmetsp:Transcript_56339/g.180896  ORF Transcript_56339/g.180896 Transcript_56339/m.180896 type:complete len:220 (+) Transcript_56339:972-1631(+)
MQRQQVQVGRLQPRGVHPPPEPGRHEQRRAHRLAEAARQVPARRARGHADGEPAADLGLRRGARQVHHPRRLRRRPDQVGEAPRPLPGRSRGLPAPVLEVQRSPGQEQALQRWRGRLGLHPLDRAPREVPGRAQRLRGEREQPPALEVQQQQQQHALQHHLRARGLPLERVVPVDPLLQELRPGRALPVTEGGAAGDPWGQEVRGRQRGPGSLQPQGVP